MKKIVRMQIVEELKIGWLKGFVFILLYILTLILTVVATFTPLLVFSNDNGFVITNDNIFQYYVVSFLNIVWIVLCQRGATFVLQNYNIEYKRRPDDSLRITTLLQLGVAAMGGFSNRLFINVVYTIILIVSHLQDLEIITIANEYVSQIVTINKYAIVVLNSLDKVVAEFKFSVAFGPYNFKRWLEFFYLKRIRFADENTKKRIVYLFQKGHYNALFYEFSYVVDVMMDHPKYDEYKKKIQLINHNLFCRYYTALCDNALIIGIEDDNYSDCLSSYLSGKLDSDSEDALMHILTKSDLQDGDTAVVEANKLLRSKDMYLESFFDLINKKIILSIKSISRRSK